MAQGPNGAGKTTTVEILEGLRKKDSGTVKVLGLDPCTLERYEITQENRSNPTRVHLF